MDDNTQSNNRRIFWIWKEKLIGKRLYFFPHSVCTIEINDYGQSMIWFLCLVWHTSMGKFNTTITALISPCINKHPVWIEFGNISVWMRCVFHSSRVCLFTYGKVESLQTTTFGNTEFKCKIVWQFSLGIPLLSWFVVVAAVGVDYKHCEHFFFIFC